MTALPIEWESPLHADFILVVDSDITSTLPVWGLKFIKAKKDGATLVVADSKETKLARLSSQWLRTKPGTGIALLNGIMKVIVDEGLHNKESAVKVPQFDAFVAGLKDFSLAAVSKITALPEEEIVKLANLCCRRQESYCHDIRVIGKYEEPEYAPCRRQPCTAYGGCPRNTPGPC